MNGDPHEPQPAGDENEDLPCLNCDYNLRGLSGDPGRCPECGAQNSRADLLLPPALVEEELKKLETLPTVGVAMMYVVVFGVFFIITGFTVCAGILLLPGLLVWIAVVAAFGNLCRHKPGWVGVLLWYHLAGLWVAAAIAAMTALGMGFLDLLPHRTGSIVMLVLTAVFLIGLPLAKLSLKRLDLQVRIWNPYEFAKEKIRGLSRDLAVERAQRRRRLVLEADRKRIRT